MTGQPYRPRGDPSLVWLLIPVLLAGCRGDASVTATVPELVLDQTEGFPCELVIAPTGMRLQGDADSVPDPERLNVRDSRGFFYTSLYGDDQIGVWSDRGEYIRTIGREGAGPGELRSVRVLLVDFGDSLHVRDRTGWSVFDSAGNFVRRSPTAVLRGTFQTTQFVGPGRVLTTLTFDVRRWKYFWLIDTEGRELRVFGDVDREDRSRVSLGGNYRAVAWAGDSLFWAGPPRGSDDGYTLEQWTVSGRLVRRIRRNVPWYKDKDSKKWDLSTAANVGYIHVDSAGLLYVISTVPTEKAKPDALPREIQPDWWRVHHEVIDPDRGVVLASRLNPWGESPIYYRRSRTGFRQGTSRRARRITRSWNSASVR